jgi:hypothetical protein
VALAESPNVARLESLDLRYNRISEAGARALAEPSRLVGLRSLTLSGYWLGQDGRRALSQRFGDRVQFV